MKRLIILLLLLAMIVAVLSGCSSKDKSADDIEARKICNFKKIYADIDVGIGGQDDIYVDMQTGILYIRIWSGRGFSPLYNADGSPKIWEGVNE